MKVRYSYLKDQFSNCEPLWNKLKKFVPTGDFTLGKELLKFEKNFAKLIGTRYALGVNSGTDAIKLSLKLFDIGKGDEVITAANTFVATVGAIHEVGARPVFVDCDDTFCIDVGKVEKAINKKTKAIVPVHFSGFMTNMREIDRISKKYKIPVIEDACQSILGEFEHKKAGTWGKLGTFSLHPLKNINVWSDGGVITTNDKKYYEKIKLLRNHGLISRDKVKIMGYNSRLDTFQAIVGSWLLPKAKMIANRRIKNAKYYDKNFSKIKYLRLPPRPKNQKVVYHLYMIFAKYRDQLYKYCLKKGIEAKIHYPIPIYRQEALKKINPKKQYFPVTEMHAKNLISFPCDQHLSKKQMNYIIKTVEKFYEKKK